MAPNVCRRRPLFGCHTKKCLHDLCRRKFAGKVPQKTFWASLRKFWQKSFPLPQMCLLLRLRPQPPRTGHVYSTFVDQSSQVEKFLLLKLWLYICRMLNMFFKKTGGTYLEAIVTKRSMLVKPTKRKYQKEILQRLAHKRIKECHRRSGKGNNGERFFKKQLEKINISPNLNKSLYTEKFVYLRKKIISEDSIKTSKDQRLRHFSILTRKGIIEKTSQNEGALEAKQCSKIFSCALANNNFQYNHCRTRCLQTFHASPLVETTRGIPMKSSIEKRRKTINRQQKFEIPRRILRSNSSQYNGCGIYNENKSSQTEESKSLADESLLCLKRSIKSALHETSLSTMTRERFAERMHSQTLGQCLVRKMITIKHTKTARGRKQFCCHQCGKCFTQKSCSTKHVRIHVERKPHCCQECGKKFSHAHHLTNHMRTHTGETPLLVARSVQTDFPLPATWRRTCEQILEKNIIVARNVEKDFAMPTTLPITWEDTLVEIHTCTKCSKFSISFRRIVDFHAMIQTCSILFQLSIFSILATGFEPPRVWTPWVPFRPLFCRSFGAQ